MWPPSSLWLLSLAPLSCCQSLQWNHNVRGLKKLGFFSFMPFSQISLVCFYAISLHNAKRCPQCPAEGFSMSAASITHPKSGSISCLWQDDLVWLSAKDVPLAWLPADLWVHPLVPAFCVALPAFVAPRLAEGQHSSARGSEFQIVVPAGPSV